jgi:hypothetical protein
LSKYSGRSRSIHLDRRELGQRVDERPIAIVVGLLKDVPEVAVGLMVVDGEEQGELAHGHANLCTHRAHVKASRNDCAQM